MKAVGIICEYNPFHNGHLYHIKKIKEMYKDHIIILVMSGNFTQRADASLIDKWEKTKVALNYVDLVIELPFVFATQSADIFAKGSIDILKALNVEAIIFGSEEDDIEKLKELAKIEETEEYNKLVKEYLDKGINYPTSMSKALKKIGGKTINTPNDLLALSYIKNLKNTNIKPISIKRTNDYLDDRLTKNITSATSIRKALKENKNIKDYVPKNSYEKIKNLVFIDDYFELIKYKIITEDIKKYQTVDEGIENRIKKIINKTNNLEDLIKKIKTKRYTYNKTKRMLLHILTSFTKEEAKNIETKYIRVLGFNKKGRQYLNQIKKQCPLPIITKYQKEYKLMQIESRVTNIYNLKKKDYLEEYEQKPIIHK